MALPRTLQTRVGRRIVLLFVVSALVPVLALAAIGYRQVRRQLLTQAHAQLARAARDVGQSTVIAFAAGFASTLTDGVIAISM